MFTVELSIIPMEIYMMSATYMIVGFAAFATLGFTFLAVTMFSRRKTTSIDIENIQHLMSYSVIDNQGRYDEENDNENYDEDESEYITYSDSYYNRDIMAGPAEFLTAVNHNHIKRPAYLHFR